MRNPLTARREDQEYERQTMDRVEGNMRDVSAPRQSRSADDRPGDGAGAWALPTELA